MFHASLLCIHYLNNDYHFPGRQLSKITSLGAVEELMVSCITDHHSMGTDFLFKVEYTIGNSNWVPYMDISRLEALTQYLELLGINDAHDIPC